MVFSERCGVGPCLDGKALNSDTEPRACNVKNELTSNVDGILNIIRQRDSIKRVLG